MPKIAAGTQQTITLPANAKLALGGGLGFVTIGNPSGSARPTAEEGYEFEGFSAGPFPTAVRVAVRAIQDTTYNITPVQNQLVQGDVWQEPGGALSTGTPLNLQNHISPLESWAGASYGDSRGDFTSAGFATSSLVATTGAVFDPTKAPTWVGAYMQDAEYIANFGVGGDTVITGAANTGWYNPTRSSSRTMSALSALSLDFVHVQYGFNDVNNATITNTAQRDSVAASVTLGLQQFLSTLIGMGLKVVYETSYPAQDVTGWASNGALRQACLDMVNANVSAWLNTNYVPRGLAAVADSAALLKQADGFANVTYYLAANNVHLNEAGARLAGATVAAALRTLLPRKPFPVRSPGVKGKPTNLIARAAPSPITYVYTGGGDAGSGNITGAGWGYDPVTGETYYEMTWTPTALNGSNLARCKLTIQSSVGQAAALFTIAGTAETFMGSARVVVDDGAGGAPNAYSVSLRCYYVAATVSTNLEWGGIGSAVTVPNFTAPLDVRLWTPRVLNTGAGALTAPSGGSADQGIALQLFVQAKAINIPVRIRLYPTMQQVG